jgi:hypothetical protein
MKTALRATVLGLAVLLSGEAVYGSDLASSSPVPAVSTQTGMPIVLAQYSNESSSRPVRTRGLGRLVVGGAILLFAGASWVIRQVSS